MKITISKETEALLRQSADEDNQRDAIQLKIEKKREQLTKLRTRMNTIERQISALDYEKDRIGAPMYGNPGCNELFQEAIKQIK